jgi:hypothetical protein
LLDAFAAPPMISERECNLMMPSSPVTLRLANEAFARHAALFANALMSELSALDWALFNSELPVALRMNAAPIEPITFKKDADQ